MIDTTFYSLFISGFIYTLIYIPLENIEIYIDLFSESINKSITFLPLFIVGYLIFEAYLAIKPFIKYGLCLEDLFRDESIDSYESCLDRHKTYYII